MMKFFGVSIAVIFMIFSFTSQASFEHVGKLVVGFESGQVKERNFILAYREKQGKSEFQVGNNKFSVSGKPESYSLAMVLGENGLIWLNEFNGGYFKTFTFDISKYKIKLRKQILKDRVLGDYVLSIDNIDYFFQSQVAQLTFKFSDKGIEEIEVDGMVASLGLNSAESDDCSVYADGTDAKAECEFLNKN